MRNPWDQIEKGLYIEANRKWVWEVFESGLTCLRGKFELVGLATKRDRVENGIGAAMSMVSA